MWLLHGIQKGNLRQMDPCAATWIPDIMHHFNQEFFVENNAGLSC
jgi:hypothetical protein